jgi:hypothetical protein
MVAALNALLDDVLSGVTVARRLAAFWMPIAPVPVVVGPLVALASLLTLALLSGVAAGSLAVLIVALVALYLLLTEVLGLSLEVQLH